MNNKNTPLIAATIIISALIISFSNRFLPSPVNESYAPFVKDVPIQMGCRYQNEYHIKENDTKLIVAI